MVFPSGLSGGEGENREWTPMGAHGGTPLRTGVDRIPAPTVQNGITQARDPVSCDGIVGCFTRRHEATKGGGWLRRPHWWRWGSGCGVLQPSLTSFPTGQAMISSGSRVGGRGHKGLNRPQLPVPSVFSRRPSSNRTCGFPAYGSRSVLRQFAFGFAEPPHAIGYNPHFWRSASLEYRWNIPAGLPCLFHSHRLSLFWR